MNDNDNATDDTERCNIHSKVLKIGDGMGLVGSGAMMITDKKHVAVRNAIESHRNGSRKPLKVPPSTIQNRMVDR
jgi:hypothetical protein